jgi:hypothetical protein
LAVGHLTFKKVELFEVQFSSIKLSAI